MARIEKADWMTGRFARAGGLVDVLRESVEKYESLPDLERDRIRNTQVRSGEVVRVLGYDGDRALIMMIDGAKGWVPKIAMSEDPKIRDFVRPTSPRLSPLEFLEQFKGTPYLWGGVTRAGIDCSGLSQLYFFSIHDLILPRNSREQRRLGPERTLADARDHSLIFGISKKSGSHHVGIFMNGMIWHACRDEGVACHSIARFQELFDVEAVVSIL